MPQRATFGPVRAGLANARHLYATFTMVAPSRVQLFDELSEAEQTNWIALATALGARAHATHVDPETGDLFIVQPEGCEDGTIAVWCEGQWCTSETSGAFESTLVKLNR